jgi:hypothetical protein
MAAPELSSSAGLPDRKTANSSSAAPPARTVDVKKYNQPFQQGRSCIRSNIESAYRAGNYGYEQAMAFFSEKCATDFGKGLEQAGMDGASANAGFKILIVQEISPQVWQKAIEDLRTAQR